MWVGYKPRVSVCRKDCPRRSATCHGTCETYLEEYRKAREAEAEREKNNGVSDMQAAAVQRAIKRKHQRRRH